MYRWRSLESCHFCVRVLIGTLVERVQVGVLNLLETWQGYTEVLLRFASEMDEIGWALLYEKCDADYVKNQTMVTVSRLLEIGAISQK